MMQTRNINPKRFGNKQKIAVLPKLEETIWQNENGKWVDRIIYECVHKLRSTCVVCLPTWIKPVFCVLISLLHLELYSQSYRLWKCLSWIDFLTMNTNHLVLFDNQWVFHSSSPSFTRTQTDGNNESQWKSPFG